MKKSKQAHHNKYFEVNWNNVKKEREGINSLTYLKTVVFLAPIVLSLDNGDTITNPYFIATTFNNYFASIVQSTKNPKIFTKPFSHLSVVAEYFFNLLK